MSPEPEKIGRYQVEHVIGRGSMGVVYRAMDPLLKRSVAVKIMQEKSGDATETIARFKREAEISAKLNHPNIITIYDVGVDPEVGPFLTMEYITGASLAYIIKMDLPVDELLRLLLQAMSALQTAQLAGIVHRDVKPENMLVSQTGHLKLMDFGLARGDQSRLTAEGMLFGTPSYTAPELLTGNHPSPATDRYAFAVTAFEALTGTLPYQAASVGSTLHRIVHEPPTIPPDLDPELQAVFGKALSKDPKQRYPDLPEFMEALIHAAPLDQEQRSKLLDDLDNANPNTSTFNFFPTSAEAMPALSSPGSATPSAMATTRTDTGAGENDPLPPTYPLNLRLAPVPTSAATLALAETPQTPLMATEVLGGTSPSLETSTEWPPATTIQPGLISKPGKSSHGLRWAVLASLLCVALGVGGYFSRSPKRLPRTIAILSEPAGALVFLEEQELGKTPLDRVELRGDKPVLRFRLAGYLSQNYQLKEREVSVKVVLKRPPLFISVTTFPPGAQVFLNGKAVGISPVQNLGIPAEGASKLKITHEACTPWEAEVDSNFPFPDLIRLTPLPKPRQ